MARFSPLAGYKFRPDVIDAILDAAEVALTYADIAACGGISRKTLWLWLKKGKKEYDAAWEESEKTGEDVVLGPFGSFYEAFQARQAKMNIKMTECIVQAADAGYWKAAVAYLERRDTEHWGKPGRREKPLTARQLRNAKITVIREEGDDEMPAGRAG